MKHLIAGHIGQWLACLLLGAGLALWFTHSHSTADTLVTLGSSVFAAGTKIKLIGYEITEAIKKGMR